ncbi:alpha and gamma adaptin binding protein p34-domain-containing protein [Aspergillus pseudodeflectus]|uniref:Alpha and gamma adaptin binding protein p34-domain-containing protein n=1 Tax=Aspergillus pseudodeflectus TaxID=176178 RepID=A0ABR4LA13_9EURO
MTSETREEAESLKSKANGKDIRNPRRLLILSPSHTNLTDSPIPSLLQTLTGHAANPSTESQSFAGYTTHPPLRIDNRYYTAEVPIWVDEIPTSTSAAAPSSTSATGGPESTKANPSAKSEVETSEGGKEGEEPPSQWAREFSSEEAQVVRDAIGAVMICIRNPTPPPVAPSLDGQAPALAAETVDDRDDVRALKSFINAIGTVRALIEEERGEIGAVPGLLVLDVKRDQQKKKKTEALKEDDLDLGVGAELEDGMDDPFSVGWWEDQLVEMGLVGLEVIEWDSSRPEKEEERNKYGELQGMRRIKEVLETHEWAGSEEANAGLPDDDDDLERELLGLDEGEGFNLEVNELEREMVGLKFAIGRGGEGDEDDEGDEELRVDAVEALLMRMRAIKDMSDELPAEDRKRFAAKAVRDIMKEI